MRAFLTVAVALALVASLAGLGAEASAAEGAPAAAQPLPQLRRVLPPAPTSCTPDMTTTYAQCMQMKQDYLTGTCPPLTLPSGVLPVFWTGTSKCYTPCALQALASGKNPNRVCSQVWAKEQGCHLATEPCGTYSCLATCKYAQLCKWQVAKSPKQQNNPFLNKCVAR